MNLVNLTQFSNEYILKTAQKLTICKKKDRLVCESVFRGGTEWICFQFLFAGANRLKRYYLHKWWILAICNNRADEVLDLLENRKNVPLCHTERSEVSAPLCHIEGVARNISKGSL